MRDAAFVDFTRPPPLSAERRFGLAISAGLRVGPFSFMSYDWLEGGPPKCGVAVHAYVYLCTQDADHPELLAKALASPGVEAQRQSLEERAKKRPFKDPLALMTPAEVNELDVEGQRQFRARVELLPRLTQGLLGHEVARTIHLARCGAAVGFIDAETAWAHIAGAVARLKGSAIKSYAELAASIHLGRWFELGFEPDDDREWHDLLLRTTEGPWRKVAWPLP